MKKYSKEDQKLLALWAADCAGRVLPFFEKEFPKDDRPRKAIEVLRKWIRTGVFKMVEIRGASLAAHAAARATLKATARQAREAKANSSALFAARAAGQAVATAHVAQHAYGAAYYALKAVAAADPENAEAKVTKEFKWQSRHIGKKLRQEILDRIIIEKRKDKIFIKIQKDKNF
jgi:hypothetical protein